MSEILLVNPRRRKKRRKMSALQRKYFGKRKRKSTSRAAAPRRRRRRATGYTVGSAPVRRRKMNPRRRRRSFSVLRRRRRNPSTRASVGLSFKNAARSAVPILKSGAVGALGGIGLDLAMGQINARFAANLPAALTSGMGRHALKAIVAILVGVAGNYVLKGRGRDLSNGAMTIVLHDAMKEQLSTMLPAGVPLGEYLSTGPAVGYDMAPALPLQTGMGEYLQPGDSSGMGEYVDNDYSYQY